ncbi:AraC family transcriptional regulator [Brevundimonas sp. 2R-24]|uniref:AraC family transcriptional regulator n=1 Tax=Peiella sedimenti TaxID=3061083 RepID=A0ABT8SK06_9CAUL|nr:AraC family transcriptional regulator [Caulobacteraceae bacterium XZ-24]
MPDVVEMVLRGGAATTFLLLSAILLRDGGNRTLAWLGTLFALSTTVWALNIPPINGWMLTWAFPVVMLSHGKAAAFWLFTRALFEDGFRMRALDWAVWGGLAALGGVWMVRGQMGLPTEMVQMPHQTAQIVLAGSAAWIAWKGRRGDLVEPRRRARIAFVLLSSLMMIGITASYLAPGRPGPLVIDLNVIRMFVMAVGMALLVAGLRSKEMFGAQAPISGDGRPSAELAVADPAEARLLGRLSALMQDERVYRREGLTIGALAARLGAPEYALRRLIRRLGYRNFNAYLNGWRLAEARAALLDPGQREVPISTIALDAGFGSLGPFNRAFKASEGVTPSAFRERAGLGPAAPAGPPLAKSA